MDQGNPQAGVIKSVSSSNPGFTADGAAQFTMIAASAYCPQHMGQPITQAPPTPLPPQQQPFADFPIITPGARVGRSLAASLLGDEYVVCALIANGSQ